jgi:hypothetical protein
VTPTHRVRSKPDEVFTAWQFDPAAGIPVWVARHFHRREKNVGRIAMYSVAGHVLNEWDWALAIEKGDGMLTQRIIGACPKEAFAELFERIP